MNAPFSARDFFDVFARYNTGVWPAQVGLLALALAILTVTVGGRPGSARLVYGGLALLWAWAGAVYHLVFFTRINALAYAFGALFLLQAAVFAVAAAQADGAMMALRLDVRGVVGTALIAYALVFYPALARALGQAYPAVPTFGAPCPLTIFTFGVLALVAGRVPLHLLAIPVLWSVVASMAIARWGVLEDIGLPLAALCGATVVVLHNRRLRAAASIGGVGETPAPPEGIRRLH